MRCRAARISASRASKVSRPARSPSMRNALPEGVTGPASRRAEAMMPCLAFAKALCLRPPKRKITAAVMSGKKSTAGTQSKA